MIMAASDEPLRNKETNLKTISAFALDQPGPNRLQRRFRALRYAAAKPCRYEQAHRPRSAFRAWSKIVARTEIGARFALETPGRASVEGRGTGRACPRDRLSLVPAFLIIDLVVASVLMSMGMMMLPPVVVSLPFKLIFFVLVDGWSLVAGSLVQSYGG
jgi:hypothetical protein